MGTGQPKIEHIRISAQGERFKEHIVSLGTKEFFKECNLDTNMQYLASDREQTLFDGLDRRAVMRFLKIDSSEGFEVLERNGHKVFVYPSGKEDGPVVMHIHGGAFVFGYTAIYARFDGFLASFCGATVYAPT
ncbi:MAG: hypothetical protein MJZ68_09315, partial [archaeon]|nr:hypothetical protein [archaeon]